MRLFVLCLIFVALGAFAEVAIRPIEHESQVQHHEITFKVSVKPAKPKPQLPSQLPQINGESINLKAYWSPPEGPPSTAQVFGYTPQEVVHAPKAIRFFTNTQSIRLKSEHAVKVLKVELIYRDSPQRPLNVYEEVVQWDGSGHRPLSKTFTEKSGKKHQLRLTYVVVKAHDPRIHAKKSAPKPLAPADKQISGGEPLFYRELAL